MNNIVGSIGGKNYAHPQLTHFLYNASNNKRSLSIMFNSDSTGNENTEFIYLFAQWLTTKYPAYTVRYRLWNDTSNNYNAPASLNTGTSAFFIDVWNFANSGRNACYILHPSKLINGLFAITNTVTYTDVSPYVDLIVINHGHNQNNGSKMHNIGLKIGEFTEIALQSHPFAGVVQMRQNPYRDTYDNEEWIRGCVEYAMSRGFCIANAWDKFVALNKDSSLYNDNIHPSATGTVLMLNALTGQLSKPLNLATAKVSESLISKIGKNFMPNGNFTLWTTPASTPPDGWNVVGGSCAKDTTVFDDPTKAYSCKVTANGGAACYFERQISAAALLTSLKGSWVTMAMRVFIDETLQTTATQGRAYCFTNTETSTPNGDTNTHGAWVWKFHSVFVKNTDSYVTIRIHLDSTTGTIAGKYMNIDRTFLFKGNLPMDSF